MKPKYKYTVNVHVIAFDAAGQPKGEPFHYEFDSGDLPTMRSQAFKKANDLMDFFENEMPAGTEFHSPIEAQLKGYKNIQGYSISIYFYIDDYDYQIEGDEELQEEMLEVEEIEFKRNGFEYHY